MKRKIEDLSANRLPIMAAKRKSFKLNDKLLNYLCLNARHDNDLRHKLMEPCKYVRDIMIEKSSPSISDITLDGEEPAYLKFIVNDWRGKPVKLDAYKIRFLFPNRLRSHTVCLNLLTNYVHVETAVRILEQIDFVDLQYTGSCIPNVSSRIFTQLHDFYSDNSVVAMQAFIHAKKLKNFRLDHFSGEISISDFVEAGGSETRGYENVYFNFVGASYFNVNSLHKFFEKFVIHRMKISAFFNSEKKLERTLKSFAKLFGEQMARTGDTNSKYLELEFKKF